MPEPKPEQREPEGFLNGLLTRVPSKEEKENIEWLSQSSDSVFIVQSYADLENLKYTEATKRGENLEAVRTEGKKVDGILREKLAGKTLLDLGCGGAKALEARLQKKAFKRGNILVLTNFALKNEALIKKLHKG